MNLIETLLNKFGYVKESKLPTNQNIIIKYEKPEILRFRAEIRPNYNELIHQSYIDSESIKTALINATKKKLFEGIEKHITIEETKDERGMIMTAKLNIVA